MTVTTTRRTATRCGVRCGYFRETLSCVMLGGIEQQMCTSIGTAYILVVPV